MRFGMRFGAVMWLRCASVLVLLHGILHTVGGVFGGAAPGAQADALAAMKGDRFEAMGASRTYWDFFLGYGLFLSVNFLVQAVVFWQMSLMAKTEAVRVRPVAMTFAIGYVGFAVLAWRYFFAAPAVFELLIAGCLIAAFVAAGRGVRASTAAGSLRE